MRGSSLCLRLADGRRVWSTSVKRDAFRYESFYASASSDGTRLYTLARSGKVLALSAEDGSILWTQRVGGLGYVDACDRRRPHLRRRVRRLRPGVPQRATVASSGGSPSAGAC